MAKDNKYADRLHFAFESSFENLFQSMRELNKQRLLLSTLAIGALLGAKQIANPIATEKCFPVYNFFVCQDATWLTSNIVFAMTIIMTLYIILKEARFFEKSVEYYHKKNESSSKESNEIQASLSKESDSLWRMNIMANVFFGMGVVSAIISLALWDKLLYISQ